MAAGVDGFGSKHWLRAALLASTALVVAAGPAIADSIGQNGGAGGGAPNYSTAGGGAAAGLAGDGSTTGTNGGGGSTGGNGAGGSGGASDSGGGGGQATGLAAGGGGGGAGGAGLTLTTTLTNNGTIQGGNGGNGGSGASTYAPLYSYSYASGGGGGGGGSGIITTTGTTLTNFGIISGGDGGGGASVIGPGAPNAFQNPFGNGAGGNGGNGITATASSGVTITNSGTIRGGGGGSDFLNLQPFRLQAGGNGIIGQNLTIINNGSIQGGARGGGAGVQGILSTAIVITGGTNGISALTGSDIGAIELAGGTTQMSGAFNNALQVDGGAILVLGADGDATGFTNLNNAGGTINIGDGDILSAGAISNVGGGTINLGTGATLFGTGNTLNNSATINVGADGIVMSNGDINNNAGGIINFNGPVGTAKLSPAGYVNNSGQINVIGGDVDVQMSGINNQNNGSVSLTGGNMLNVSTFTNSDNATLHIGDGYKLSLQTLAFNGGSVTGTGTIEAASAFNLWGAGTISARLAGTAVLTRGGSGTTLLTGHNTYTGGTTINAGTLQLGTVGTAGSILGEVTVNGAGTLNLTNADTTGITSIRNAGTTNFQNGTSASTVGITNDGTVYFYDTSSAGGAVVTNNNFLEFHDTSSASSSNITNSRSLLFYDNSSAGTATIANDNGAGLNFQNASSAGNAHITNDAMLNFYDTSTAGSATVTNNSLLAFYDGSNAGSATITNNASLAFNGNSDGGAAKIINNSAGTVNFSGSTGPAGNNKISVGSIAGMGTYLLGANELTVGSNGLSTEVGGVISGTGGSLNKVGTGTLTLSGVNSFTGGTTVAGGTLSISADGNLGTGGTLSLMDGTTLAFTQGGFYTHAITVAGDPTFDVGAGQTVTQSGVISDGVSAGDIVKAGAGTLVLTANNSYSGGTTISGGTLQLGNGGATGSIMGNLLNNGVLAFNRSDDVIFSGDISGSGAVRQSGSGTTIFTGTNSYSGGTSIESGTLQLGNGGVTGSILGNVLNDGVLAFNRAGTLTLDGDISGSGAVQQNGPGITILSGTNSYSGGTRIESGTLQLGNGGTTGSITGNVTNNGTLTFDRSGAFAFSGMISGNGALNQIGTGTTTLTGTNSSVGAVAVSTGALALSQTGTFGATSYVTQSGAVTAIGGGSQLVLTGALTQDIGSTLNVSVGSNEPIITAGSASLSGTLNIAGVTVSTPTPLSAGALAGTQFTVIATTNGITGDFAGVSIGGSSSPVDYLTVAGSKSTDNLAYNVGLNLTWLAGAAQGNGTFTLANAAEVFNVDVALANQVAPFATGWDGHSLTKEGLGTLTLSAANTYTGSTTVTAGTLVVASGGSIGSVASPTSDVTIASSATLENAGRIVTGALTNDGTVTVAAGGALTANNGITNHGTFTNNGTVNDDLDNTGHYINNSAEIANVASNTGTIINSVGAIWNGNFNTAGVVNNNGTIIGSVTQAAGATTNNGIVLGPVTVLGGLFTGVGSLGDLTIASGARFQAGSGVAGTGTTVNGTLELNAGSTYVVNVSPAMASKTIVNGTATLTGSTVNAVYASGSYISKQYTILTATGGLGGTTFSGLTDTNLPANFHDGLSYDSTNAYLNLALDFRVPGGLNRNQQSVANALTNYFDTTGGIPAAFGALSPAGLSRADGELATGVQRVTFDAMNQFMGVMADPSVGGWGTCDIVKSGRHITADNPGCDVNRWTVWGSAYGAGRNTDGNAAIGSSDVSSHVGGLAVGANYRFSPYTVAGFAMGGGTTGFGLGDGMGSGRSDLFQAGAFVHHAQGPGYVTGTLAYGWQDVDTDRSVAGQLHADFNANALSGRLESGWRFDVPGGIGLTPYAAAQFTGLFLPGYLEHAQPGTNTFALSYDPKTATDGHFELGLRADKSFEVEGGVVMLGSRLAWAHNFNPTPSATASFQALPESPFVMDGASIGLDAALTSISAEMRRRNGWAVGASFDGAFSGESQSYGGKATLRYQW